MRIFRMHPMRGLHSGVLRMREEASDGGHIGRQHIIAAGAANEERRSVLARACGGGEILDGVHAGGDPVQRHPPARDIAVKDEIL